MMNNQQIFPPKPAKWLLLIGLFILGIYYLSYDIVYAIERDRDGESFLRTFILICHAICATPLLILPPFQYSRRIRSRWPKIHRRCGQIFLSFAIIAAVGAVYLAINFEESGRRPPLLLFALLWIFFAVSAWLSAVKKNFKAHQHFVSLTYAVALGFVLVRVLGDFSEQLFPFIEETAIIGVTREWLCFVIPIIVVEIIYSWRPHLKSLNH